MAYSRTRARDTDREAAIEIVSAAYADGQLTSAEHGERVTRLRAARTFADLDAQLVDLQRPGQSTWSAPARRSVFGSGAVAAASRKKAVLVGVGFAVVAGVVAWTFTSSPSPDPSFPQSGVAQTPAPDSITNPMTPEGWRDFLVALEEQTGSTVVLEAYLRTDSVSVTVPVEGPKSASGDRVLKYMWDGEWSAGDPGTSDYRHKDLAKIDPETFAPAMEFVASEIEEPENQDVSMFGNLREGACFAAYASNRFDETEMRYFTCDGTVMED